MEGKFTIGAIVLNHAGVLTRVAGLFAKRSCNIDSLAVGETEDPEISRMTIIAEGDEAMKDQMLKQLLKLHDVNKVAALETASSNLREHMLVKLAANKGSNDRLIHIINEYGGKVVDFSQTTITAEFAGYQENNEEFIRHAKKHGIIELCRAGVIALAKGEERI
jgi:acetolactate synthase-1/3 small subunit